MGSTEYEGLSEPLMLGAKRRRPHEEMGVLLPEFVVCWLVGSSFVTSGGLGAGCGLGLGVWSCWLGLRSGCWLWLVLRPGCGLGLVLRPTGGIDGADCLGRGGLRSDGA